MNWHLLLTWLVYDVTKYLDDHPGGKDILLEVAGTNATEAFEEVGHSDEAREQLQPYYIGDLPTEVLSSWQISFMKHSDRSFSVGTS